MGGHDVSSGMTLTYLVQHGEKEPLPGDPGLIASVAHLQGG